jgi:hypothetical protein
MTAASSRRWWPWCRGALLTPLAVALVSTALGATAAKAGDAAPTLGSSGLSRAEGFGEIRPPVIFLGGDPSGLVGHIHWRRWGKPRAIGHGTGWWIPEGGGISEGHLARARLVAWDLGTCAGRRAYLKLEWYFPEYHRDGDRPSGSYFSARYAIKACDYS